MSTARLEAFSDGVLAVAITLLVLNISVPHGPDLWHALTQQWQEYLAYVTSFITIGIIWVNHHAMIGRLRETDHTILVLNLFLLMSVGVLPFATALVARYLKAGYDESLAAGIYSGSLLLMSLFFSALNRQILLVKSDLLATGLPESQRRFIFRRSVTGIVPYVIAIAVAPVSPYATLAICAAVAAYYATPLASASQT
ncbi:MAG TPA: TMEM175 family protein [Solirubrobacteraceae bacterium]|nr:TMEM175 family protein [Solirubrobacteraceae bacterium]